MSNVKITDLRREVKERLSKKGIVDLSEFKLKPIDVSSTDSKKMRNSLEKNLTKIGGSLLAEISNSDISEDDKISKLKELLEGEIKVEISKSNSSLVKRLVKSFNKGKEIDDTYLDITISEGGTKQHTHSTLYYEPTKKQEGYFTFKFERSEYIPFASLKKLVGTLYFFNKLREYIKTNENMSKLVYVKYIQDKGIYKDEKHRSDINQLAKEYNLPLQNNVSNYISKLSQGQKKLLERTLYFEYLEWLYNNNYFHLNNLFDVASSVDGYMLYSIRNISLVSYFFNHIYDLNIEEEYDVKEEISISSDYARSYETKKNIPQKVLDKMETTSFKKHFGYVEFDELVDLDKVDTIESEWGAINEKILFPVAKDHSLRFRRLGKHKAAGLYFSGMKAVCVDLGGPYSMIHEVFHMIDYTMLPNATLSSMFNFRGIIERYREVTNKKVESLDDTNDFKVTWNGKTKYNKEYFHSVKEIFARCGELYIANILEIESSLVKADNKILYPSDDEFLLELITKYYSTIIQLAPEKKEESKIASSPSSNLMSKEEIVNILQKYQISMFDMIGVS